MKRALLVIVALLLGAAVWAIFFAGGDAWLNHTLGFDNLSGPWYGFWSGFGSDLTEFAVLAGLVGVYRKHNCHVQGCWRLSWKNWVDPDGHTHALCRRHHPHDAPTAALINERAAREKAANE